MPSIAGYSSALLPQEGRFGRAWRSFQATQLSGEVPSHPRDWPAQVCSVILHAGCRDLEEMHPTGQQRVMEACSQYTMGLAALATQKAWRWNIKHLSLVLILGPKGPVRDMRRFPLRPHPEPLPRRLLIPALLHTETDAQLQSYAVRLYDQVQPHGVSLRTSMWCLSMALGIDRAISASYTRHGEASFEHLHLPNGAVVSAGMLILRDPHQRD
jgi:hypothetical protein